MLRTTVERYRAAMASSDGDDAVIRFPSERLGNSGQTVRGFRERKFRHLQWFSFFYKGCFTSRKYLVTISTKEYKGNRRRWEDHWLQNSLYRLSSEPYHLYV